VNFAPTAAESVSGNVLVSSNATNSPAQIALTGSGVSTPVPTGPLAAFPGAEGGGALSVGGRGGVVMEVTNLNDSGSGSLRACVEASGPRTCVFRVGGTIVEQSRMDITNPYITIAGQTAPGGGIQLMNSATDVGELLSVGTHDVIIRYIRGRMGNKSVSANPSPFSSLNEGQNVYNVMWDHVSAAWAYWDNWQVAQAYGSTVDHNITLQWSILAEPNYATNGGVSAVVGAWNSTLSDQMSDIDIHHNFITGGNHRNPSHRTISGRIVNNLIYNSTYYSIKTKGHKDIIGNYMKDGPYCCRTTAEIQTWTGADGTSVNPDLYIAGNAANTNGYNPNADQWSGGLTGMTPSGDNSDTVTSPLSTAYRRTTPLAPVGAPITIDSATDVASANGVLLPAYPNSQGKPGVGASAKLNDTACDGSWVSNRDSADANFVAQFNNNTGHSGNITSPGTAPILAAGAACASSLHDGIADQWKIKHGLSTTDTTLYRTTAPNGYTYLENYLNGTDPNVTASMSSATSFWAGRTSKTNQTTQMPEIFPRGMAFSPFRGGSQLAFPIQDYFSPQVVEDDGSKLIVPSEHGQRAANLGSSLVNFPGFSNIATPAPAATLSSGSTGKRNRGTAAGPPTKTNARIVSTISHPAGHQLNPRNFSWLTAYAKDAKYWIIRTPRSGTIRSTAAIFDPK
jgi:hypothetical protein